MFAVGLAATTVLGCCLLSAFTGGTGFAGATLVSATLATVTVLAAGAFALQPSEQRAPESLWQVQQSLPAQERSWQLPSHILRMQNQYFLSRRARSYFVR